jgi:aminotransferase EvaB
MTSTLAAINDLRRHVDSMRPELERAARDVIDSGWFVLGAQVDAFESEFAAYCGSEHCIGVANGTDALELALRALGIGQGHRVATVANAGLYSTTAITAAGATPIYVDVDPATLLVDRDDLARAVDRERPHAVIVTHLFGRLADMASVLAICAARCVPIVEDCAQAHGAARDGHKAGTFGDVGCYSFYPTKNLGALGDGGAIVTRSAEIARNVRSLRQYGWTDKYHAALGGGRNSRLDEMQAAFLRVALPRLDDWNAQRLRIARRLAEGIDHRDVIGPRLDADAYVAHLFVVRSAYRDSLAAALRAAGIATDVHYPVPDHRQPAFAKTIGAAPSLPTTERCCNEVLTLPCFPEMTDAEADAVIAAVNAWRR